MLSAGEAIERIVESTPRPSKAPACQGCAVKVTQAAQDASVSDIELNYSSPAEAQRAAEKLSIYRLVFQGTCDYLRTANSALKEEL